MGADIAITLHMPPNELHALAQFLKRVDYDLCNRLAGVCITYNGRSEGDTMWAAVRMVQRQLAEHGFAPR